MTSRALLFAFLNFAIIGPVLGGEQIRFPEDPFVRSALGSAIKVADPEESIRQMAIARQRVASLKTRDPSERGTSVVVFQKGMTADQISGLMKDYKLDLRYVEIKAPAERGQIWTIGLGNFDLAQSYGSVQDQIEGAVNAKRAEFARTSLSLRGSGDFDSAAQWENLANADMFIYRIDAAGAIRDIGRLADNHNVLHLVAVDKEDRKRQAAAIQQIIEMKRVERSESKEER